MVAINAHLLAFILRVTELMTTSAFSLLQG